MAVQVRVIVDSLAQRPGVPLSEKLTLGAGSQLSIAVACPVLAGLLSSSQSIVTLPGTVNTGAVVSTTSMI